MFDENKARVLEEYEQLIRKKNEKSTFYNGVIDRYVHPVLTRGHVPPFWKYDFDKNRNPYFMERLGINAVFNAGAFYRNGKYYIIARVEGNDRKSFFAVAESDSGVDGFRFWDNPVQLPLRYRKVCCQNRHNRSPVFGAASAFFLPDPLQNLLSCRFSTNFQISGCSEI